MMCKSGHRGSCIEVIGDGKEHAKMETTTNCYRRLSDMLRVCRGPRADWKSQ